MNRNPAKPKVIMAPCTCAARYVECNCAWLRCIATKPASPKVTLGSSVVMILAVLMVIVGLSYLFGG